MPHITRKIGTNTERRAFRPRKSIDPVCNYVTETDTSRDLGSHICSWSLSSHATAHRHLYEEDVLGVGPFSVSMATIFSSTGDRWDR